MAVMSPLTVKQYKLLQTTNPDAMSKLVQEYIDKHWELHGHTVITAGYFYQAVVAYFEKE